MLPPALRFDLLPRCQRRWLRPVLAATVAALVAVAGAALWPRQAELERLSEAAQRARAEVTASQPVPHSAVPAPWGAAAEQDGRLLALTVDARLLEIERCTDARMTVAHIAHNEAANTTSIVLAVAATDGVAELVGCLNTGAGGGQAWRLVGVEMQSSGLQGQRVTLRRE